MLIITNRKLNQDGNENAFGDDELSISPNGLQSLHVATAAKSNGSWQVEVLASGTKPSSDYCMVPDFKEVYLKARTQKNCVFFIHGNNQSFKKNLEKCYEIEHEFNVDVIAFSWPSNPFQDFLSSCDEYAESRKNAKKSARSLKAVFETMSHYEKMENKKGNLGKFSLLAFSLGSYLFQKFIELNRSTPKCPFFDNIILCQADVDRYGHSCWADRINFCERTYVTINQNDWALSLADNCKPLNRLGDSKRDLNGQNAIYIDFTDGKKIGRCHELFRPSQNKNKYAKIFFNEVMNGKDAKAHKKFEKMFEYHENSNRYRFRPWNLHLHDEK